MKNTIITNILGYPEIGDKRELKKAIESFWRGETTEDELTLAAANIKNKNWKLLKNEGIDLIPSNDFTLYDQMLDMSCLLGNIPERFGKHDKVDLDLYFRMARGKSAAGNSDIKPCEMTKWFNTNYHYIVPELSVDTNFKLSSDKIFNEFNEALEIGILTKPVLIGPITYLMLSKNYSDEKFDNLQLLGKIIPVYLEIIKRLGELGAEWIQLDEPILSTDISSPLRNKLEYTYSVFNARSKVKLMVADYFGNLEENLSTIANLNVNAIHVDASADEILDIANIIKGSGKLLSIGIVNGQNIWANDLEASRKVLSEAADIMGKQNIMVAASSSLKFVPVSVEYETNMDDEIKSWLSFAKEKVKEISVLSKIVGDNTDDTAARLLKMNSDIISSRKNHLLSNNPDVRKRCANIAGSDFNRKSPYTVRAAKQRAILNLPKLPTTTIGSFPQTKEIRKIRSDFKKGNINKADYDNFIAKEIKRVISFQEKIEIDVLVHGEPERNDMVEYFSDMLNGFMFTQNGWVRSYGTRCVKPPVIYGDVSRKTPMTVKWTTFAQSLTKKPVKGMLTGPITMIQWSFVRDDQPLSQTAVQIALSIRDEVLDLQKAGIRVIQIDEPALREGLPLHRDMRDDYLKWAINSFKLAANGVSDVTQIHTHMCYSEFNDIIRSIADMDTDVISVEASRSNMELLNAFVDFEYPNEIGPGIYDIHSPRVPSVEEIVSLIKKAMNAISPDRLWVNPDCGLKTRGWKETTEALSNMIEAAKICRSLPQIVE